MFDLKDIRKNPASYDQGWARRGLDPQTPAILELDEKRRAIQTELQVLQAQRNDTSKKIGQIKSQGGDASDVMAEVARLKDTISEMEQQDKDLGEQITAVLSALPNILFDDVPDGADEDDNIEVRKHGEPKRQNAPCPDHVEIGEALGMMSFEHAAKMSGARFVVLHSGIARLERALAQFMLDTHVNENGYTEVSPPLLVRDEAMYGTGQLPKFAEDLFRTTTDHWLIPTAEVSLTNMVAGDILSEDDLPMRFTAFTPCFRSEAGSAGRDTRGMIRQHQFYKVEMVSITSPEQSQDEHERMTNCAEKILQALELPYRTVTLCSGDTGFGARKTYDIEVWLPGQQAYREISSCSNCGDFQARRMKARFRPEGSKETSFVHTLNGSGLAVGRTLIAVLENYYDASENCVHIPQVLKPYMGGLEKLSKIEHNKKAA
jgi:seryl-tRNA synthetase